MKNPSAEIDLRMMPLLPHCDELDGAADGCQRPKTPCCNARSLITRNRQFDGKPVLCGGPMKQRMRSALSEAQVTCPEIDENTRTQFN